MLKEIYNNDPGPGSYSNASTDETSSNGTVKRNLAHIAFNSLDQRFKEDPEKLSLPGPCYYNPQQIEKKVPTVKMKPEH